MNFDSPNERLAKTRECYQAPSGVSFLCCFCYVFSWELVSVSVAEKAEPFPRLRFVLFPLCSGTHVTVLRFKHLYAFVTIYFISNFPAMQHLGPRFSRIAGEKQDPVGEIWHFFWFWCVWKGFALSVARSLLEKWFRQECFGSAINSAWESS